VTAAEVIAKCVEHDYNRTFHDTALCVLSDLARAGYAVVELPKPEAKSPHSWIDGSVTTTRGLWRVRLYLEDHRHTSAEARQIAAALLAAADIAEADAL
jgi:hypothetical protein